MSRALTLSLGAIALVALIVLALFLYTRNTATHTSTDTLRLGEYGVELTLDGSLVGEAIREARQEEGIGTVVHVLSTRFTEDGTACPLGAFYTIEKDSVGDSATTWTEESLALWQAPQGEEPARVKQFTGFYLIFEPSETPCSEDEKLRADEAAARHALADALTTARYIQY